MDKQTFAGGNGILDFIRTLSSNWRSGKLELKTAMMEGAFFFRNGQLVDARVGDLTGFRAINAAASMRDVSFSFDPSIVPPSVSSITPNERVVLKQFFGIDVEPQVTEPLIADEVDVEPRPTEPFIALDSEEPTLLRPRVVAGASAALTDAETATVTAAEAATVTSAETARITRADTIPVSADTIPVAPAETPAAVAYIPPSNSFYRSAFLVAALLILMAVTAVAVLYTFGERGAPVTVAASTEDSRPPATEEAQPTAKAAPTERVATTDHQVAPTQRVAPTKQIAPTDQPKQVARTEESDSVVRDLTGKWKIVNTIQKTSYTSFKNMQIGFDLSIEQTGNGFIARGEKVSENGRSLAAGSRTPIQVKGVVRGDRVEATFFENGAMRKTNGRFVWKIDEAGRLNGTFVAGAARSSGKSTALKL